MPKLKSKLLTSFVREVVTEAKATVWPKRQEVIKGTVMVVVSVVLAMLVFASLDYGLQKLLILAVEK